MKNKSITITALFFLLFFLTPQVSKAQDCCAGFDFVTSQSWCLGNVSGCNVGTTCTGPVLEAAHGLGPGNWVGLQCAVDCSGCSAMNTALPVELVKFNVNYIDHSIELLWATASETRNEGFEIERSKDGLTWTYLDFIEGKGDTQIFQDYRFVDKNPMLGFNYYRLKQLDFDGAFEYSPVKVAIWQGSTDKDNLKMAVLPNPATTWITAALPNSITKMENIEFSIYDQIGRLVKTTIIDQDSEIRIDLDGLSNGFYILHASQNNFQYSTSFIKK